MRVTLFIYAVVLAVFLSACSNPLEEDVKVERAADIMAENSDSAYVILTAVDRDRLFDEWEMSRYDLLLIEAQLRSGRQVDEPGRISTALRYFEGKGDDASLVLVLLLLGGVYALGGVSFYRMRSRQREEEVERQINDIQAISDELKRSNAYSRQLEEVMDERRVRMNDMVETLFREKWSTLDMLCNEYYLKGDSAQTRGLIVKEVEREIERVRNPENLAGVVEAVNIYMDRVVDRLRVQCPKIKEQDITFISLVYAGFSPRAVSLLTGINHMYFYKKRSRLIEKIRLSDAVDREEFIMRFGRDNA